MAQVQFDPVLIEHVVELLLPVEEPAQGRIGFERVGLGDQVRGLDRHRLGPIGRPACRRGRRANGHEFRRQGEGRPFEACRRIDADDEDSVLQGTGRQLDAQTGNGRCEHGHDDECRRAEQCYGGHQQAGCRGVSPHARI
ncbi:hypothetical protein D3C72_1957340 [compost metagenome]